MNGLTLIERCPTHKGAQFSDCLACRLAEAERERDQMREAILWACGERGTFPEEPPPLNGKWRQRYHWRTELRRRAFGASDSATAGHCRHGVPEDACMACDMDKIVAAETVSAVEVPK